MNELMTLAKLIGAAPPDKFLVYMSLTPMRNRLVLNCLTNPPLR
jgi:hypothetical protein